MARSRACRHTHMDISIKSSGQPKAKCSDCGKRLVGVVVRSEDGPVELRRVAVAMNGELYRGKWRA